MEDRFPGLRCVLCDVAHIGSWLCVLRGAGRYELPHSSLGSKHD